MIVKILREDIDNSSDRDPIENCYVAAALRRVTGEPWEVGSTTANPSRNYKELYILPVHVTKFIKDHYFPDTVPSNDQLIEFEIRLHGEANQRIKDYANA